MINAYSFSCQGESHKATDKVCQDYSMAVADDSLSVAIVCDGHGGEPYFRSDVGAEYAAEAALHSITFFVENGGGDLFKGQPFTAVGTTKAEAVKDKPSNVDKVMRQLFSSIIYQWNEKIKKHAQENELTEWEKANVPQKYLDRFLASETFEKHYGCTLMVYVQTKDYWFAFHIGDGKCYSFQEDPIWDEPIPWDDDCFLNKTTSLCDSQAINEFRYCYEGDGKFPTAIFLGSDGMDDSFGAETNLVNFYIQVMKLLVDEGLDKTILSIESDLPQLSKIGSKDDMSIAFIYNPDELKEHITDFIQYQINTTQDSVQQLNTRIKELENKISGTKFIRDEKERIELDYAKKDLSRAKEDYFKQLNKHDVLMQQLSKEYSKK